MQNNRLTYWACLGLGAVWLLAAPVFAQEAGSGSDSATTESAADVERDDGTTADGAMIIPEAFAMYCGLSSKDGADKDKITACLDKIAAAPNDQADIQRQAMLQITQNALETGLKYKSEAGNYEATLDSKLGSSNGVQPKSAAAGGEASASGSDMRADQTKNIKISSRNAASLANIINVYTTKAGVEMTETFFKQDLPHRQTQVQEDNQ